MAWSVRGFFVGALLLTFLAGLHGTAPALAWAEAAVPAAQRPGLSFDYDVVCAATTTPLNTHMRALRGYDGPCGVSGVDTRSNSSRSAAKAGDEVAAASANVARAARQPSTPWGRTIHHFRDNPDDWRRVSAHAEEATGKTYRGGTSIEEVFERGTDRLVRHRIYGPSGDILHERFRPYAKFGAP
jgi:hypothetical protein